MINLLKATNFSLFLSYYFCISFVFIFIFAFSFGIPKVCIFPIILYSEMLAPLSAITTHVLDTSRGFPAKGLAVSLHTYDCNQDKWMLVKHSVTNEDGRCMDLVSHDIFQPGEYKLSFQTALYFEALNMKSFFPHVEVVFTIRDTDSHIHIPLLLNPFSYTTYRGT